MAYIPYVPCDERGPDSSDPEDDLAWAYIPYVPCDQAEGLLASRSPVAGCDAQ